MTVNYNRIPVNIPGEMWNIQKRDTINNRNGANGWANECGNEEVVKTEDKYFYGNFQVSPFWNRIVGKEEE